MLVLGPTGVGKTFLACALGHQAAQEELQVHTADCRICSTTWPSPGWRDDIAACSASWRARLLILDDWALARLTAEQRRDLMEVIDDRHDRAATLLASQIPVDHWHGQIGAATYADAILDRIVHTAYRLELCSESMRKRGTANSAEAAKPLATTA